MCTKSTIGKISLDYVQLFHTIISLLQIVDVISETAKQANVYVAIHLYEKARCHVGHEMVRSNLVFDRKGEIVAV